MAGRRPDRRRRLDDDGGDDSLLDAGMSGSFVYDQSEGAVVVDPLVPDGGDIPDQQSLAGMIRSYDALFQLDLVYAEQVSGTSQLKLQDFTLVSRNDHVVGFSQADMDRCHQTAWYDIIKRRFLPGEEGDVETVGKRLVDVIRTLNLEVRGFTVLGLHPRVESAESQIVIEIMARGFLDKTLPVRETAIRLRRHPTLHIPFALAVGALACSNYGLAIGAGETRYNRDLQDAYKTKMFKALKAELHRYGAQLPEMLQEVDATDYVVRLRTLRLVRPKKIILPPPPDPCPCKDKVPPNSVSVDIGDRGWQREDGASDKEEITRQVKEAVDEIKGTITDKVNDLSVKVDQIQASIGHMDIHQVVRAVAAEFRTNPLPIAPLPMAAAPPPPAAVLPPPVLPIDIDALTRDIVQPILTEIRHPVPPPFNADDMIDEIVQGVVARIPQAAAPVPQQRALDEAALTHDIIRGVRDILPPQHPAVDQVRLARDIVRDVLAAIPPPVPPPPAPPPGVTTAEIAAIQAAVDAMRQIVDTIATNLGARDARQQDTARAMQDMTNRFGNIETGLDNLRRATGALEGVVGAVGDNADKIAAASSGRMDAAVTQIQNDLRQFITAMQGAQQHAATAPGPSNSHNIQDAQDRMRDRAMEEISGVLAHILDAITELTPRIQAVQTTVETGNQEIVTRIGRRDNSVDARLTGIEAHNAAAIARVDNLVATLMRHIDQNIRALRF